MNKINWFTPKIDNINKSLLKTTLSSNFISEGKITQKLENKISKFLKINNVIMTASGTSAIYLALRSLNITDKDEIILPNITYVATLNAIKLTGAKPVIVDVDLETSTIDLKDLKKKINQRTKAIIFVHISGRPGNLREIIFLAKKKKIKIIEDAAESFGSSLNKKKLGTLGDLGCFSFTPTKIITAAQGGAIVTKNKNLAKYIRSLKDQGRTKKNIGGDDEHDFFGGNFKFNDILASILIPQVENIKNNLSKAKKINNFYRKHLKSVKSIKFYKKIDGEICVWTEIICNERDKLFNYLLKNNIKCRKIWKPLSKLKSSKIKEKFNNSDIISKNVMWLPSGLNISVKDLKFICSKIKKFC